MAKYINPYTDFGFKKLFGEEGNKDLLIDFLNQLLPSHHQIESLNFRNVENLADLSAERKAMQYGDLKSALETAVEEKVIEIAKNLILLGSDNDHIAKATGLTVMQIEVLRSEVRRDR